MARVNIFLGDLSIQKRRLEQVSGLPVKRLQTNAISSMPEWCPGLPERCRMPVTARWPGTLPELVPRGSIPMPILGLRAVCLARVRVRNPQAGARSGPVTAVQRPILDGFGQVRDSQVLRAFEVGDSP